MTIENTQRLLAHRSGNCKPNPAPISERLSGFAEPFLEDRQRGSDDHPIHKKTVRSYRLALKTFASALDSANDEDELLKKIRLIIDWKLKPTDGAKPMKASGINVYIRGINAFFSWLWRERILQNDIKIKLLATPRRKRPRTINTRDIQRLTEFRPTTESELRTKYMALLILDTGLRAEECLHLQERDIDWCGSRVWATTKGRGDEKREVPLSSSGKKLLRKYLIEKAKRRMVGKRKTSGTTVEFVFSTARGESSVTEMPSGT